MKHLLVALIFMLSPLCVAGGYSYKHSIKSIKATGDDCFTMEVEQLSRDRFNSAYKPRGKTIHLRYAPDQFKAGYPNFLTKDAYLMSVNQLLKDHASGIPSYFGVMGEGLIKLESNINEWQSNALYIMKEADGSLVVYSFANSI